MAKDTLADAAARVDLRLMRLGALFAAILIYSFWGEPTPDYPGVPEFLIGGLLVFVVGAGGVAFALGHSTGGDTMSWILPARLLCAYGLIVPVFVGLANGNDLSLMLRDLLPFLFVMIPLLFWPLLQGDDRARRHLTFCVAALGTVFSIRVLSPYIFDGAAVSDPLRLANSPAVLFSALLLAGLAGLALVRKLPPPYALKSIAMFLLALLPLTAMALITQRASIGYVCLAVAGLCVIGLVKYPQRVLLPMLMIATGLIAYWQPVGEIAGALWRKTELVGLNMRVQEVYAVFGALHDSAFNVIFGKGWGASVLSPAAGGAVVNFTHNIFTTYWLKSGLVGVILLGTYLFWLGIAILRLLLRSPVIALALAGPFMIDVTLYASFKSLDFGLLLLLIVLWGRHAPKLQKNNDYSKQDQSPELTEQT